MACEKRVCLQLSTCWGGPQHHIASEHAREERIRMAWRNSSPAERSRKEMWLIQEKVVLEGALVSRGIEVCWGHRRTWLVGSAQDADLWCVLLRTATANGFQMVTSGVQSKAVSDWLIASVEVSAARPAPAPCPQGSQGSLPSARFSHTRGSL
ncbi:hypothetical protein P7K49_032918 [Saguinus oedipus]|uniref:Uncharacterized protein n=1 Tax=Saguinus oedipus TaxID=9490 RepID=A0ABQ9TQG5_SAGOE|nr:hypothetical protein P7K49_032918 [Saguinus oedipus]